MFVEILINVWESIQIRFRI